MGNVPLTEQLQQQHFPELSGEIAYLCACIDERFIDAFLSAFRRATGTQKVYFETEPGGAPAFGSAPASATLVYQEKGCRIMGWGAHGTGCAGFPGRGDDELRQRLQATVLERSRDFPGAVHYSLFARISNGQIDVEVVPVGPI